MPAHIYTPINDRMQPGTYNMPAHIYSCKISRKYNTQEGRQQEQRKGLVWSLQAAPIGVLSGLRLFHS